SLQHLLHFTFGLREAPSCTPAITITLPIQKRGAPETLLRMRSAPLGMRLMRMRASFISAPVVFTHSCRMASARGSVSIGTPNAFATQSAVMSGASAVDRIRPQARGAQGREAGGEAASQEAAADTGGA